MIKALVIVLGMATFAILDATVLAAPHLLGKYVTIGQRRPIPPMPTRR